MMSETSEHLKDDMSRLASLAGNETGPNVGDSKIYASGEEILLFEAKQIPFDLHHQIELSIRKAERQCAELTRSQIIREIEMKG